MYKLNKDDPEAILFVSYMSGILEPVLGRYGQLLATMTTTGCEYAAAVGSRHALTETMLVDALAHVRLECPFHCMLFLIFSG